MIKKIFISMPRALENKKVYNLKEKVLCTSKLQKFEKYSFKLSNKSLVKEKLIQSFTSFSGKNKLKNLYIVLNNERY